MIWIVLRSGRVLQYNNGGACSVEDGAFVIRHADKERHLIARIPSELVERAEFERPCEEWQRKTTAKLPKRTT